MILSKYSLIVLIILFSVAGIGQKSKSITGYYVTKNGDTVNCTFLPRNWKKQPIEVKIFVNGKEQKLTPTNSKWFYLSETNTWYKATKIEPALYEQQMQFANSDYIPEYDSVKPVFAKRLFKSDLALWLYVDPVERKHFLLVNNDHYVEIYKHLYTASGGFHGRDPIVAWFNQYIYVLRDQMKDCPTLFPIIEAFDFNEEDLIKLLALYKTCKEDKKK